MKKKVLTTAMALAMLAPTMTSFAATTTDTVGGDDKITHSSELQIAGSLLSNTNQAPEGQISVILPTAASFTVDADGTVITPTDLAITNNSSCEINVKVSKFTDSTPKDGEGITLVNAAGLVSKDRSYVNLTLLPQGGTSGGQVELLSDGFRTGDLGTFVAGSATKLSLVGQAGQEDDASSIENGVRDDFTLTFTIAKN